MLLIYLYLFIISKSDQTLGRCTLYIETNKRKIGILRLIEFDPISMTRGRWLKHFCVMCGRKPIEHCRACLPKSETWFSDFRQQIMNLDREKVFIHYVANYYLQRKFLNASYNSF